MPSFATAPKAATAERYFSLVKRTIDDPHSEAQQKLSRAQACQKQQHDVHANATPFETGQRVMLHSPHVHRGRSRKFHKPWSGLFRVIGAARPPGVTYTIREEATGKVVVAHGNRVKHVAAEAPVIEWQGAAGREEVGYGEIEDLRQQAPVLGAALQAPAPDAALQSPARHATG